MIARYGRFQLGVAGEEEGLDLLAFATQDERPVARRGSSE